MKWPIAALLIAALAAVDCARPAAVKAPVAAQPAAPVTPPLAAAVPPARASTDFMDYVAGDETALQVRAEAVDRRFISNLVPDLQNGVWGGQDGELFQFRLAANGSAGRLTYGRPHLAATWVGELVRLSDSLLAGKVTTSHLVRRAADGQVTEVAPARSPGGAPFDWLDERKGELHLHDRRGVWYTLSEGGKAFTPVTEFAVATRTGEEVRGDAARAALERDTGGTLSGWIVPVADGSQYAIINREQLFTFDTGNRAFNLLGNAGLTPVGDLNGQTVALTPVGSLNGQIVARSAAGLVVVDAQGRLVRAFPVDLQGGSVLPGADGWFYSLPFLAINVITGEQRRFELPRLSGGVNALIPLADGRLLGGTDHGGSLFVLDVKTGAATVWGRPIPELGQLGGEEIAPIQGLVKGPDGYLYAAIGTGAQGRWESHLVRLEETGRVLTKLRVPEPIHGLVVGADGRIYGSGLDRVVIVAPPAAKH